MATVLSEGWGTMPPAPLPLATMNAKGLGCGERRGPLLFSEELAERSWENPLARHLQVGVRFSCQAKRDTRTNTLAGGQPNVTGSRRATSRRKISMCGTAAQKRQHLVLSAGDAATLNPSRPGISFYQGTEM